MAPGPNQHYIPQKLLRGFASGKTGKHTQVWVYPRNGKPFPTSTRGVGASRYFNSPPEDMRLEKAIGNYEQGLDKAIDELRALPDGAAVASSIAAELTTHLVIRAAYLREMLSAAINVAIEKADNIFANALRARAYLGLDGPDLSEDIDKQIHRAIDFIKANVAPDIPPNALYRFLRMVLRENFDALHDAEIAPNLVAALAAFSGRAVELATKSHRDAMLANLIPAGWLDRLLPWSWRVRVEDDASFILPDCVAIARKKDAPEAFVALAMGDDDELDEIILPLASNRLLVGHRGTEYELIADAYNRHAAASSQAFFVSATMPDGVGDLSGLIGKRMAEQLREALRDRAFETSDAIGVNNEERHPGIRWGVTAAANPTGSQVAVDRLRTVAKCVLPPDSLRRVLVTTFAHDYAGTIWAHEASQGRTTPDNLSDPPGSAMDLVTDGPDRRSITAVARHSLLDQIASDDVGQSNVALQHVAHTWGRAIFFDHWENAIHGHPPDEPHAWLELVTWPARTAMESYMATRLAVRYVPEASPDLVSDSINALASLKSTIQAAGSQFRADHNAGSLLAKFHEPMMKVAIALGASLGDATERGSIEPHESLHLSLEALGLSRWWPILAADLATRFTDRATWSGSDALERLEAHIERIYAAAGVLLERNGDRVTFYLPAVA